MSKIDDKGRLEHMLEQARKAQDLLTEQTLESLSSNEVLCLALVKRVEIIGEAASKVSRERREQFCEIPWHQIVRMRNRLIHGYDSIDLSIVWRTVTEEIPRLILQLEKALEEISAELVGSP